MAILRYNQIENITKFNRVVNLDFNNVNNLFFAIRNQNIIENALYGDITNWLISLTYFPIRMRGSSSLLSTVYLGANKLDNVECSVMDQSYHRAYYLNSINTENIMPRDNYRYTEPYCTAEMFLPYYGKFDIPTSYLLSLNFINIYLVLDVVSGSAKYVVGASPELPKIKSGYEAKANESRGISYYNLPGQEVLIGEYPFQLGIEIPINTTGEASRRTNMAIQALGTVSAVATMGVSSFAGAAITTVAKEAITTTVNQSLPKTKGAKTTSRTTTTTQEKSETTSTPNTASKVSSFTNTCIQNALQLMETLSLQGTSQNVMASSVHLSDDTNIKLIIKRKQFKEAPPRLFGRPYGKYVLLNTLNGFATIGNIIFDNFSGTQEELAEIKTMLSQGVVF